ncbi:MAG: exodeoxyribonuclease VII large subunit [Rhodobacterales bacterium]|nr:exodeoxyribonuclease VII large subunit [Rhodobacterales bacterium]
MSLFEDPSPKGNLPEFSVSDLSGAIKRVIEGEFGLVRVRGEVGRVSRPASGHLYLDLKDDRSVLSAIIWKGQVTKLAVRPEEGMEVLALGRLTTFPGQSKYQMIIEEVAPAGVGALMAMLEKRKEKLAAEGLFDLARKKPLPYLPEVIGVITSPSGAVIRDILHRLRDRFPRRVLVWPVAVQGAACAPEVDRAIAGFNALAPGGSIPRPDLLIVARGGGSIEDLWGFNEEIVARAAAASEIPLISAVGHETDTTLIDLVSDMRAPTPSAAAELAVPVRLDLMVHVEQQGGRLSRALTQGVGQRRQHLRDLARALPRGEGLTAQVQQRLDSVVERLTAALRAVTAMRRLRLADSALRPGLLRRTIADDERRTTALVARIEPAVTRSVRDRNAALVRVCKWFRSELLTERIGRQSDKLSGLDRLLGSFGYEETLRRGYAVVRADGQVVTTAAGAAIAQVLEIQFQDGRLQVGSRLQSAKKTSARSPPEQGSLL